MLTQKAGFNNTGSSPIIILDEFQEIFYDTSLINTRVWQFNLPSGEYYVESGKFQQMYSPLTYPLVPLPKKERNIGKNPEEFKQFFADNPHLASVDWKNEKIIYDHSMRELPSPAFVFIKYHEYAHRFYISEQACDIYASNRMLTEGYNPSQIGYAIIDTLSDKNHYRKENIVNALTSR